jgi:hypothetical protein
MYIQVFSLIVAGILLLWFGYTLFFTTRVGKPSGKPGSAGLNRGSFPEESYAGAPQTCPVCAARLKAGELVSSSAFPSFNGTDRLMHIRGCVYCLSGERERICPVCGAVLHTDEILVSRMFERAFRRSHVHVLGCSRCRKAGL